MKKVLLMIMDGVGIRENSLGNAYKNADTNTLDRLMEEYPHIELEASGEYVGLPKGQMGNSEVGHSSIGSGRVIYQSLERINKSIEDKSFYNIEELLHTLDNSKKGSLHLLGLLSDGGIHSTTNHLYSILTLCKEKGLDNVYIHVITDGRDTSPTSGIKYIKELKSFIKELGIGKIASISGRYYTMDRDNNYDRIKKSYDTLTLGTNYICDDIENVWKKSQDKGVTDEFIEPVLLDKDGIIKDNDTVIIYNYRPDRLREIGASLTNKEDYFERKKLNNIYLLTMMPVAEEVICKNIFKHEDIINTLGEVISNNGLSQLRIAETEKYAHVTYFFDGGKEIELKNTKRVLIPSPKVATYDLMPEMSAYKITDRLIEELQNKPNLIVLNYANGDMVGHTGVYEKGIDAVNTIDKSISKLLDNIDLSEYTVLITADHGNCEQMINDDGSVNTQHTTNRVPFIILDKDIEFITDIGSLPDIAPTILKIMNINIPEDMTGKVLVK